jgi:hypothetical protein
VNWDRESVYLSGHDDRATDYSEIMQLFMTPTDIEMMLGRNGNWHDSPPEEEPPRTLTRSPQSWLEDAHSDNAGVIANFQWGDGQEGE